jgi:NAD(P)-dependent dehydrogenase (short-subunit alcohol dehydrogenase family)
MDLGLKGKVIWITGASDGLGAACALRLAQAGARLALCARGEEKLRAVADSLKNAGAEVLAIPTDVTQPEALKHFAQSAASRFGQLDGLVNNAGASAAQAFDGVDDAAWQADLDLKLMAAIRLTRAGLPLLRKHGGSVVNVLALAAKTPGAKSVPSSISRAAGMALTKALSKELGADQIRVNAVLIGLVQSGQWERKAKQSNVSTESLYAQMAKDAAIPLGRFGRSEEMADLVSFLLSERAAYVTGTAINFDGGMSSVV